MYDVFSLPDFSFPEGFLWGSASAAIRSKATISTATPGIRNRRITGKNLPGKPATTGGFSAKMRGWSLRWDIGPIATPSNGVGWNRKKAASIKRRSIITRR